MVIQRLDDSQAALNKLEEHILELKVDVAVLKTKAALFGAGGGIVVALIFRMLAG